MKWEFEDFIEHYKPVQNNLSPHAGYNGCLFADSGDELEYIRDVRPEYIWTLVEGDYGNMCIIPGYHLINRFGYFQSSVKWDDKAPVEIYMDDLITTSEAESKCRNFIEDELNVEITDEIQDKLNEEFL